MQPVTTHHEASEVSAEEGNIILEGPDGVAVTMSRDAAEETARRILQAVSKLDGDQDTSAG